MDLIKEACTMPFTLLACSSPACGHPGTFAAGACNSASYRSQASSLLAWVCKPDSPGRSGHRK